MLVVWIVHDTDERWGWRTSSLEWPRQWVGSLPRLPALALRIMDVGRTRMAVAMMLIGLLVAAAAEKGAGTAGPYVFFLAILAGFGIAVLGLELSPGPRQVVSLWPRVPAQPSISSRWLRAVR